MPVSNRGYAVRAAILGLLLVICGAIYGTRSRTLAPADNSTVAFTNPSALEDWVTNTTYTTTLNHIRYYLATQDISGTSVTIASRPSYDDSGQLLFTFKTETETEPHTAVVKSVSYGEGLTSTAVSIDGESQAYAAADTLYGAAFTDFGALTDNGLAGTQVYGMQQALVRHMGDANYSLDSDSIIQSGTVNNATTAFSLTIDGKKYRVQNTSDGIDNISLSLFDSDGKLVFQSGKITLPN